MTTKTRLLDHIKAQFVKHPALLVVYGDASPEFPARWAAKRLMASVQVCIDGQLQDTFIELPNP